MAAAPVGGLQVPLALGAGYSVSSSPFVPGRLAIATAANFGIVGNGRAEVVDVLAPPMGGMLAASPVASYATNNGLFDVAWSELAESQFVGACGDGTLKLWDVRAQTDGRPLAAFCEHQAEASGIDWNLVAKDSFASASWDGTLKLWAPESPASILTLAEHGHCVYECRWAPHHASWLLSASGDRTAKLWDPKAGPHSVLTVACGEGEVLACDWSRYDAHVIATGSVDTAVAIWDVRRPASPLSLHKAHGYAVRRVRFSPHAPSLLLSASYDMSVCLWVVAAAGAPPVRSFNHHTEFVVGVEWSLFQEGLIASCGWDGALFVWHRDAPCAHGDGRCHADGHADGGPPMGGPPPGPAKPS